MFDPTVLPELHADASALQTLLASGMLDAPSQVNASNHLLGLQNSISFIESMGRR
jgi:hypothetical protein